MIYLDNAATSWPKPACVAEAVAHCITEVGANPGRAGHHLANEAGRIVYAAREAVARLFGAPDPMRVILGFNVTWALNLVLRGMLRPGDRVVTTGMEHNAVMRPLRALERDGVRVHVVPCAADGTLDPADVAEALEARTALVVLNHASNVCGTLLPGADVAAIAHKRGVPVLLDVAQSAGALPMTMDSLGVDLLAFTGHKALMGPMGTGGLVLAEGFDAGRIAPLVCGGTGSRSEQEIQPDFLPDKFEAGTPNVPGLAGLAAGVSWVLERGVEAVRSHELALSARLWEGLASIEGVRLVGPADPAQRTGVISFSLRNVSPSEAGLALDENYDVACRVGLHCAPAAHRTLGTFPDGTIRFGLSVMNTMDDVDAAVAAVAELAEGGAR